MLLSVPATAVLEKDEPLLRRRLQVSGLSNNKLMPILPDALTQRRFTLSGNRSRMPVKFMLHAQGATDMKEHELEKTGERTREDPQERSARELIELLSELRVILPGVQFL